MPRARKPTSLESAINQVISAAAAQIAAAVRAELANGKPATAKVGKVAKAVKAKSGGQRRSFPAHCIAPGCTNPHSGPSSGFFCKTHNKLSKAKKEAIKAARKAAAAPAPAAAPAKKTRGGRRGSNAAAAETIFKLIQSTPGLRSEQIQKKLPIPPKKIKAGLSKLRAAGRVKTKGIKRAMVYNVA